MFVDAGRIQMSYDELTYFKIKYLIPLKYF